MKTPEQWADEFFRRYHTSALTLRDVALDVINDVVAELPPSTDAPDAKFPPGSRVKKAAGYRWPGVVVAVFRTLRGELRYVVECTSPDVRGALHIYNESQLEARP